MAADETDGHADESPGGTAPTEPLNTVTAPASASTAEATPAKISRRRLIGVDVLIGVDDPAPGRRHLRDLGQSPPVQP